MAYGDVGGCVSELVITCKHAVHDTYELKNGDAVYMQGNFEVSRMPSYAGQEIFGQCLKDSGNIDRTEPVPVPVRVHGVSKFYVTNSKDYEKLKPDCSIKHGIAGIVSLCNRNCKGAIGRVLRVNIEEHWAYVLH